MSVNVERAYFHMFNRITDIINLLEDLDTNREIVDVPLLLKQVQAEAEGVFIQ